MVNAHTVVGAGPHRVIALNGWFTDRTGYRHLWPHLDTERFTYAFMDYRGYGEELDTDGEFSGAEIAADALALVDHLGWDRFTVMGHSMGGLFAQHVLLAGGERVRALVGINPVPASGLQLDMHGWGTFARAVDDPAGRRAICDMVTGHRLSDVWLDGLVRRSLERSTKNAFGGYLPAWARADLAAEVTGNPVPVLVIVGEHDAALGEATVRPTWLRHYPNARLEVLGNCGHYPMDETPVILATVIERFLRGIS